MKFRLLVVLLILVFGEQGVAQELVTLEEAIALALKENYDVQLAQNLSLSARTDEKYSVGALLPQLNGTAATNWNSNHQEFAFADESRNVSGDAKSNNATASLQAVWTLFDGTKMFATRERLEQIAAQGELNVKNQMVNSISAVIVNYYNIVRQKQQLKAIQELMSVNEERVKVADRKVDVGIGARPELLQAKVDLNAQRTLAIQQETLIAQLKDQLNGLVGLRLPANYDVADTILINLDIREPEISADIENKNYQLLSTDKNREIASLMLRESRASRSPIINFNGAYNYSKTNNTKLINPFSSLESQINGFTYGFSMTLPILNGFNITRNVQQARINVRRQELLYNQQKQSVDVAVRNAYVNYDNTKKILVIEEENISLARENVSIALESFKRGVATFIELRTAQQSLAEAYNRLIAARYNTKVAETELLRLNGSLLK
ncbi:MAG: TolC family protein [Cyclobacteriaceae bacterium]|nr:TolC family protein [Cyclobacteriaceae bacterium]